MRICIVARTTSLEVGGVGRVPYELRRALIKRGHEVTVIECRGANLLDYFTYATFEIPLLLSLTKYDVYHAISPVESIWLPKKKSIVTFLDTMLLTHPGIVGSTSKMSRLTSRYFRYACQKALEAKEVVAISENTKQSIKDIFSTKKDISVIRLGIREDLEPRPRRDSKLKIGYLGQLDKRKRVDLLVRAVMESDIKMDLFIGGTGLEADRLSNISSRDGRVQFLGYVADEQLVDFYNSLDIFVFPSKIEGYGLPIVEAMACRKPVVVLDDAIIPEELKDRCVIVDGLDYVLGNEKYLRARCESVDLESNYLFAKEHSWDKCVGEYEKVYEECIE